MKKISDNVSIIEMKRHIQSNEKENPVIFIRNCQKLLWDEVYNYLNSKIFSHCLVTGNPGIGKTRSMSYLLKILLEKGNTIIYEARKNDIIFIFLPQEDKKYKVWSCPLESFKHASCSLFNDEKNYYLIDPNEPKDPFQCDAHTVLCASSNIHHYKEFIKRDKTKSFCMPIWKKNELWDVKDYFKIQESIFEERYLKFGGRIRYIYGEEQNIIWMKIITAIGSLSFETLIQALTSPNYLDQSTTGISSFLFIYDVVESKLKYKYEMTIENCKTIGKKS